MFVMCENPNKIEASTHPTFSFFVVRCNMFCSNPRNKNSSGHAVKQRIASAKNGSVFHSPQRGPNVTKCIVVPRGIAIAANPKKLPKIYSGHRGPQSMLYPVPENCRTSRNAAIATVTQSNTVNTYANRPPGNGQNQCDGENFTAVQTPATVT